MALGYAVWLSFSVFYVAILDEFHWSRAATAATFSVFTIVYGFGSMASGTLVDRLGPRLTMPVAAVLVATGLLLTTRVSSLPEYYLFFGLIVAVGLSGLGMVPSLVLLNAWFVRRRGLAVGVATAGIGVGTMALVPLLQRIILDQGWRVAYVVLAVCIAVVIPLLSAFLLRHRPSDMGLLPDGMSRVPLVVHHRQPRMRPDPTVVDGAWASAAWTLQSAALTSRFWLLLVGRYLEVATANVLITHHVAFFVDNGYDRLLAAATVGSMGIVGSLGQVFSGTLSDRIGRETTHTMFVLLGAMGVAVMLLIGPGMPSWVLYAYALTFGLFWGSTSVLMPVLSADIFQGRGLGSILGGLYVGGGLGAASGAFLGGYVFDLTGSYDLAFALAIPALSGSCLCYWVAAPRKVRLVPGRVRVANV